MVIIFSRNLKQNIKTFVLRKLKCYQILTHSGQDQMADDIFKCTFLWKRLNFYEI